MERMRRKESHHDPEQREVTATHDGICQGHSINSPQRAKNPYHSLYDDEDMESSSRQEVIGPGISQPIEQHVENCQWPRPGPSILVVIISSSQGAIAHRSTQSKEAYWRLGCTPSASDGPRIWATSLIARVKQKNQGRKRDIYAHEAPNPARTFFDIRIIRPSEIESSRSVKRVIAMHQCGNGLGETTVGEG